MDWVLDDLPEAIIIAPLANPTCEDRMIRHAIIPIAGKGTRMYPVARAVPKALLPLVDPADRLRCVLHAICAEAGSAGVTDACVVVSPDQRAAVEAYFAQARRGGFTDLPERILFVEQTIPAGFGDAVLQAAGFAAGQPVLLMLGDHVHLAAPGEPGCAAQVVRAYVEHDQPAAMVGMQTVGAEELRRVGTAAGEPIGGGVYRCTAFIEKPSLAEATQRLMTPGLAERTWLAHGGIYAFGPNIFDCLAELARANRADGAEVELAAAQAMLLDRHPDTYLLRLLDGQVHDTGNPAGYARAFAAWRAGSTESA